MATAQRLAQLEEQLRDIEARWVAARDQQQQQQQLQEVEPVVGPSQNADEPHTVPGGLPRYEGSHDITAEVQRIQEIARLKSVQALRQELLPPKDPPWQPAALPDASHKSDQSQQPAVLVVHAHATAPEAWRAAKSTQSIGLLEASTWEAQKAAALLALESEKRSLQETVDKLTAAQQQFELQQQQLFEVHQWEQHQAAQRHLMQLQRLAIEHREQMLQLNLQHQQEVQQAAGKTGDRLLRLQRSAWLLFRKQRDARLLACAFFVWQRAAVQTRKLAWAEAVWNRRTLDAAFTEWHLAAATLRNGRHSEAAGVSHQEQLLYRLEARACQHRLRCLLDAWQQRAQQLVHKRRQAAKADQHRRHFIGQAFLLVLAEEVKTHIWQLRVVNNRLNRLRVLWCFRAWVQLHRLHHLHQRRVAFRVLLHWRAYVRYALGLRRRVTALQDEWQARLMSAVLAAWGLQVARLKALRATEAAITKANKHKLLSGCMNELRAHWLRGEAVRQMHRGRTRRLLLAWHSTQLRLQRNCRVLEAHQASRLTQTQRLVFQQWMLQCAESARRAQVERTTEAQAEASNLLHELQTTQLQQAGAAERVAALQLENRRLRVEARQNLVLHAPEGFLNNQLQWKSLPADPDQDPKPRQRSRHLTLLLPGLQGVVDLDQLSDPIDVPSLSCVLLIFGGVSNETWYNDVQLLSVTQSAVGNVAVRWQLPLTDSHASPGIPPLPCTRDFAGCACGPNQFLIHGGFDGTSELSSIHVFDVHRLDASSGPASYSLKWRAVEPRNTAPSARSHHTAAYHRFGRTVLAFGGYSSSKGHLSELWAFSFDHMEWWQPETLGDYPPARRNHVAAVVANKLLIHGGFNGTECLDDLWELDLGSWQWAKLKAQGLAPSARRGHAADVINERYMVVHGGYDGTRLLSDAAMYDTLNGTWSQLDMAGGPDDTPAPRSLHTLTSIGHACVVLGGSGSLGPLEEVHLLENPAITAGLVQEHKLLMARKELVEVQERAAQLQAQLGIATLERDRATDQQQLVERRAADLTSRHNAAVRTVAELQAALEQIDDRSVADLNAHRSLEIELAAAHRRLQRARQGGQQVAVEAETMHVQLCDARAQVAELELSLDQALSAAEAAQASALQLSAERQTLQAQLAAASCEVEVTRRMSSALEQEHLVAAERQQLRSEREVNSLQERLQEQIKRVVDLEERLEAVSTQARKAADAPPSTPSSPSKGPRALELAQLTERALKAEMEAEVLRKEYSAMQQELATAKHEVVRERAAQQAACRTAADAVEDKHRLEYRYQRSIEQLEQQIRALQTSQWARDLDTTQQLVKGIAAAPSVQALHHMLWQGSTPPAAQQDLQATPDPSPQVQRAPSDQQLLQQGSSPLGAMASRLGIDGSPFARSMLPQGQESSQLSGNPLQLSIPLISLNRGLPQPSEPGMPHVTELLRLRSALLLRE